MLQIIHDPEHLVTPAGEQTVSNVSEYAGAYAHILTALQTGQPLRLIVHHQAVFHWFKNLALRYPQRTFVFETLDARGALAQKWAVALPAEVRNEEIIASGLLALDLPPAQPGQRFDDLLLAHFYGPLLAGKNFPFTQLQTLLQIEALQRKPSDLLLARTLHQRLEEWKALARSPEQRQVIDLFAANPAGLRAQLMQFRVLRAYPSLGESLLGGLYSIFAALKLPLQDLAVNEAAIPGVVSQVTYHLNAHAPQSAEELNALLAQVSGLLWVEYESIEKHLRAHPEWISIALLESIANQFEAFSARLNKPLQALRAQIRPAKPSAPAANWDSAQMLAWATEHYLPYQAWCSIREQFDKDLYAIGDQFSAWLMENWNDLHANSKRMVFNILPNLAAEFNRPGRIHLLLVVDNLGWSFTDSLRDLFQQKGFFLTGSEPYFAMLPTETEISKKCLLSGAVGYTMLEETSYKRILESGWVPYFGKDTAFEYLSDISKLKQVESISARVYVVNYLAIDRNLHKSSNEIGMSHREHVQHLLEKLVENVATFVEKHALADRIRIHVVSDHGSTQLPAEIPNELDPAFFKQSGFSEHSHRFISVSDARFATLADNLKLDCFFLPANDFLLPTNVLCARRANRFLPTDQDVFVHGGLLPEEVIVPYMVFEPASVPLKDLDLRLDKNLFRYRPESLELKIGNPNDAAVEQVQISALNGNVEWPEWQPIPIISGHHDTMRTITARFKLTSLPEEQVSLSLRVRFRARGETHVFDVKLPIEMRKMVEEKSTNVFDD